MTVRRKTWLCRYQYDPLDRVVNCAPLKLDSVQRFYRKNRLVTEIQGPVRYSVFEHESQLMAQQQREASQVTCTLLATDLQRSVSHVVADGQHESLVYPPYGHQSPESGLSSLLGFNGERRDPVTGHYLLGNGYRAFNPVLMRFNSPDSLSPFGKGGVNAYAYCAGDPVNRVDPTGNYIQGLMGWNQPSNFFRTVVDRASSRSRIMVRQVRAWYRQAARYANTWRPSYAAEEQAYAYKMADRQHQLSLENLKKVQQYPAVARRRAADAENHLRSFEIDGVGPMHALSEVELLGVLGKQLGDYRGAAQAAHFAHVNVKNLVNHPEQLLLAQNRFEVAFSQKVQLSGYAPDRDALSILAKHVRGEPERPADS